MLRNMLITIANRNEGRIARAAAYVLGFIEGREALGMTWEHPDAPRSIAYDNGRSLRVGREG